MPKKKAQGELKKFGKLFKYGFKSLNQVMAVYYILLFISAILERCLGGLSGNFALEFIKGFADGFVISMIVCTLINAVTRVWQKFNQNFYGPESYLTHALPVKTGTILKSWISLGIANVLTSVAMCGVAIAIAFLGTGMLDSLMTSFGEIASVLGISTFGIVVSLAIILVLELVAILMVGILANVIGHRSNNNQIGRAIFSGLVIYAVMQTVIFGVIYTLAAMNDEITALFSNNMLQFNTLTSVIWVSSGLYAVSILVYIFTSNRLVRNGVDIK